MTSEHLDAIKMKLVQHKMPFCKLSILLLLSFDRISFWFLNKNNNDNNNLLCIH